MRGLIFQEQDPPSNTVSPFWLSHYLTVFILMGITLSHTLEYLGAFRLLASPEGVHITNFYIGRDRPISLIAILIWLMERSHGRRNMKRRKQTELSHPNFVAVRLSDTEMAILDQACASLGTTRSEYLRRLLTEKEICNNIEIVADCKLRSNGMPVPLLRNGYSHF